MTRLRPRLIFTIRTGSTPIVVARTVFEKSCLKGFIDLRRRGCKRTLLLRVVREDHQVKAIPCPNSADASRRVARRYVACLDTLSCLKLNTCVVFNLETGWLARGGRSGGIVPPTLHDAPKGWDLWNRALPMCHRLLSSSSNSQGAAPSRSPHRWVDGHIPIPPY